MMKDRAKKWLLMAGYLACMIILAFLHEPWVDELHAWVMAKDLSLGELISSMRDEGHFCLWFLILMPFAKGGFSVFWLQIISISFTLFAAWLLVFKTEFNLFVKVAILLSFPMIYFFPVISRCYALIPPLLFGIALTYRKLDDNKYLFAVLVGILAHTHVFMEGMVLSLFLVYIYKIILPKYREKKLSLSDYGPLIVIIIFVLLAFVQVARNPFSTVYYQLGNVTIPTGHKGFKATANYILKGYSILPPTLFEAGLKEVVAYTLAFVPMLLLSCCIFFYFSNIGRFIIIISVGWQVMFSLFVFYFGHQRIYLPYFIILSIFIMMGKTSKKMNIMIVCLCFLASFSGYLHYIRNDIHNTYSSFKPLAEAIDTSIPKDEPVYSIDFCGDVVSAYLSLSSLIKYISNTI